MSQTEFGEIQDTTVQSPEKPKRRRASTPSAQKTSRKGKQRTLGFMLAEQEKKKPVARGSEGSVGIVLANIFMPISTRFSDILQRNTELSASDLALIAKLQGRFMSLPDSEKNASAALNLRKYWREFMVKNPGITQTVFARDYLPGWSQGNFSQYLTGKAIIGNKALNLFCRVFNCQPGDIRYELRDYRMRADDDATDGFKNNTAYVNAMAQIEVLLNADSAEAKSVAAQILRDSLGELHAANSELEHRDTQTKSDLGVILAKLQIRVSDKKVDEIALKYGMQQQPRAA
ncbi:hypothetical protein D3C87_504610 [compost metagenome]